MKENILDQLSKRNNESLIKLIEFSEELLKIRHKEILNLFTDQEIDIEKVKKFVPIFKNNELPNNVLSYLCQKKYKKNDIDFVNFILDGNNFLTTSFHKQKILEQFVLSSLGDSPFFHKVDKTEDVDNILIRKMKDDGFNDVHPAIFISLAQKYDLEINLNSINKYLLDINLPVFKVLYESSHFSNFFNQGNNLKKTILKAIEKESTQTIDSLSSFFKIKKETKNFFSDPQQIEKFCKTTNLDFFEYVMNNFKCDNDNYVFLSNVIYFIPRSSSKIGDKIVIAIDALVKNNFENKDFVEQIKRKISNSYHPNFKESALMQFNMAFLENSLPEKQTLSPKIKI